jgi:hypothetical protein
MAWEDNTPGNRDIFFTRSTDSGITFPTTPVNLSSDSGLSLAAQIAADKNGNLQRSLARQHAGYLTNLFQPFACGRGANQPPTIVTPPANQTVTAVRRRRSR